MYVCVNMRTRNFNEAVPQIAAKTETLPPRIHTHTHRHERLEWACIYLWIARAIYKHRRIFVCYFSNVDISNFWYNNSTLMNLNLLFFEPKTLMYRWCKYGSQCLCVCVSHFISWTLHSNLAQREHKYF